MNEEEEDAPQVVEYPKWKFSGWDVAGIAVAGVAGVCLVASQALNLVARELAAMANYSRENYDYYQAKAREDIDREAMAEALRGIVDGEDDS